MKRTHIQKWFKSVLIAGILFVLPVPHYNFLIANIKFYLPHFLKDFHVYWTDLAPRMKLRKMCSIKIVLNTVWIKLGNNNWRLISYTSCTFLVHSHMENFSLIGCRHDTWLLLWLGRSLIPFCLRLNKYSNFYTQTNENRASEKQTAFIFRTHSK